MRPADPHDMFFGAHHESDNAPLEDRMDNMLQYVILNVDEETRKVTFCNDGFHYHNELEANRRVNLIVNCKDEKKGTGFLISRILLG